MSAFELVWDSRGGVSECPTRDSATRKLLLCDIPAKRIHALHVDTGARETWEFADGQRMPVHVLDGNYQRISGVCPWWDATKAAA